MSFYWANQQIHLYEVKRHQRFKMLNSIRQNQKDAKLIIIHSGINNLREKEETESCIKAIVEAVTCLKEAVPQANIMISKLLPIGDRDLNLKSSVLNE